MQRLIGGMLILALVPGLGLAQSAKDSWDNLKLLQPGQRIEVVEKTMRSLRGPFVSVSEETIMIEVGKSQRSIERTKIVRVSVRDTSHRTRNMLLGAGILGGIALAATAVPLMANSNEGNSCSACAAAIAAGFGGGVALGAIPASRTVYRIKK